MTAQRFSLLLLAVLLPGLSAEAQETPKTPPMTAGAFAVDGMVFFSTSPDHPFTLRIVGADAKKTTYKGGQFYTWTEKREFQLTFPTVATVLQGAAAHPPDRDILAAHAVWECQAHNDLLHLDQTAKPEFLEIAGRTWAHWTYDLKPIAETLRKDPKNPAPGPGPRTQQLLTTVLNDEILVLVSTTMLDQDDAETKALLLEAAKTLVVHPQPLTQQQLRELCAQKQR